MSFLRFSVQAFFFGGTDSINSLQPGLDDFFPIDLKFQHGRLDYPSGYAIHNIHIHTQLLNTKDNLENLDIIYILYRFIMVHSVHDATEMPGVWIFHDFKVENDDVNLEQQSNKNMKEM